MHGIDAVPENSDARMMLTLLAKPQNQYRRRKSRKALAMQDKLATI
jgi:hypothetical protein